MNQGEKKENGAGLGMVIPAILLMVICCAGPLLIVAIGSAGLAAIVGWVSDPLMQTAAVIFLVVLLAAFWRRRLSKARY